MAQFKPGQSGNPAGRPKGIVDKRMTFRKAFEKDGRDIVKMVIQAARDGDMTAARMVLERLTPPLKPRPEPVQFKLDTKKSLTSQASQIMQAVSKGILDPNTGRILIDGIASLARVAEMDEIRERIEKLEAFADES